MDSSRTCSGCGAVFAREATGGFCLSCLLALGLDADTPVENGTEGTQIGPYRLLEVLGTGGMGVVYLAEQQQPLRRRVALKLVKPSIDSATVISRFEAERQALALMTHPGITRVLDAGADAAGRPYFVMEVVDGVPITRHCDEARLSIRARLELFVDLCDAVQHAHDKGIIHRDLKPTNILITQQNGRPVPKIIDFGVAKALDQRLTERTLFTELGVIVGTPEYMSPEQADPRGGDVDTRTDVYALGVLLYELLVGVQPFDPAALRASPYPEIQRIILEVDPPTPSARLTGLGNSANDVAEHRQTSLTSLGHDLRGDLDWVVMKALEKDRARRYASATEVARDLRHYLAHEPVLARRPAAHYRVRKFLRRHRAGFAAAAALVLAVVLGVGTGVLVSSRAPAALVTRDEALPADVQVLTRSGLLGHSLISPEGDTVIFTQPNLRPRGATLWLAEVDTGRVEWLVDIQSVYPLINWSRDGRHVYVQVEEANNTSEGHLERFSLASRRLERLQTSGTLPRWPAIAPDERRIVGVREDRQRQRSVLVVASLDGSGEREVAARSLEEPYFMPAWSPDGRTIASSVGNLGIIGRPMRVVAVDVTDGRERLLSHEGWVRVGAKTWLPDGSGLLLLGQKWGETQSADSWLWRLDARSGETRRVQIGPDELSGWQMSLSADGTTLSASRTRFATSLWVVEGTDVGRARQIAAPLWEAPRFLPDRRLVFTGSDGFLWRANADGSDKVRLTPGFYKAVAPDGSIVFSAENDGVSQIWRADPDSQNSVQLTHGPAATKPDISPDGEWVVYITAIDGAIWKIPFGGGNPVRLADGIADTPAVSPGSDWIAARFKDSTDGHWYPALVPMAGGGIARKLRLPPELSLWFVRFTDDGKGLDLALSGGGLGDASVGNVWRLPLEGGPLKQLTFFTTGELRSFDWSSDGKLLACMRGGWRGDIVLLRGGW